MSLATGFSVGNRVRVSLNLGTVRYIGVVVGSNGPWLGIEWDDTSRGKHDGSYKGRRYFQCRFPTSGSFVRPSASISTGTSFSQALIVKYVDPSYSHNTGNSTSLSASTEKIILGSSNGAIEVEAPGMDKVRSKFARLDKLREISLDSDDISSPGNVDDIRRCRSVRGLDLSRTLFPSWDAVVAIVSEMPSLATLSLNYNRFETVSSPVHNSVASVRELRLNATLISWNELPFLQPLFPQLQHLQLGYNHIASLVEFSPHFEALEVLNLDQNDLFNWAEIMQSLPSFPSLQRLILSSNRISDVPHPPNSSALVASGLKYLTLTSNTIATWSAIDALASWFPHLEGLNITENPLFEQGQGLKYGRQLVTARIPSLRILDGSAISAEERNDSERFYLLLVAQEITNEEERAKSHPRWDELCRVHGAPTVSHSDKIGNQLINITLHRLSAPPASTIASLSTSQVRILPTMNLRAFRAKILKSLKQPAKTASLRLWILFLREDGSVLSAREMEMDRLSTEVDWWGMEDGSHVAVLI